MNREISDVQLRASMTNIVSNVRNAYWDYVFTTQAVEVARQSLDLATKLVQDNQIRVEVGTMAPIDVVQAQAEQATRRQGLVTAENARRTAELALKRLIVSGTEDPNWAATLDPVDRPDFRARAGRHSKRRFAALEPADRSSRSRRRTSRTTPPRLSFLRNQTLPIVDLQVNYGVQGVGGPHLVRSNNNALGSQITETVPGGIATRCSSLFDNRYPRWTARRQPVLSARHSARRKRRSRARACN